MKSDATNCVPTTATKLMSEIMKLPTPSEIYEETTKIFNSTMELFSL